PLGGRIAVLSQQFAAEDQKMRRAPDGHKTRRQQIDEEIQEEAQRIQQREERKGSDRMQTQRRMQEGLMPFIAPGLEQEVQDLPRSELEDFIRQQLQDQGNWRVEEVRLLDLPPEERTIKIKTQVPIREGEDVRIKTQEADGEVNKFAVRVVSRSGT